MDDRNALFASHSIHDVGVGQTAQAKQLVDNISAGQFSASSDDQLVEHVLGSVQVEPLVLYEDRMTMTDTESRMQVSRSFRHYPIPDDGSTVPSHRVEVSIPYTGDKALWYVTPNPFRMDYPRAFVHNPDSNGVGKIVIVIEKGAGTDASQYKRDLSERLESIRFFMDGLAKNVDGINKMLPGAIRGAVQERRKRIEGQSTIRKLLDIPMAPRPGAPTIEPINAPRKIVRPLPPAPPSRPDWGLRDADYEHVLSVIRHEGISFESTPATFGKHDEEGLRDIILAHLNGHYQGTASGERFRKHGKTDICIEAENRAAFIAECKVWRGPKECAATADQLLSYVTWRDCRCAMVFFNKDVRGFTDVQQSAAEALKKHPLFVDEVKGVPPGEHRFRFRQKDDDKRIVTVHIFLFNLVPTPRSK